MTKRRTAGLSSFEKERAALARRVKALKKGEAEPARPTNPYLRVLQKLDDANAGKEVDKHGTDAR